MKAWIGRILALWCAVAVQQIPGAEAKRVALVVGNGAYKVGPLQNPVNDAVAVAGALGNLGFDKVIVKRNLGVQAFRAALAEMAQESAGADVGVVYFAGHGTEVAGRNFLIPVDATLGRVSALDLEAIPLDTVLGQLDGVRKLKLVILDACRNNLFAPAGAKRAVGRGLARIEPEDNTLVVYAAKDGTTADDGIGRAHSPFTEALLKHIATPGLEINLLFRRVRDDVIKATSSGGEPQQPHVYASLGGQELYLASSTAPAAPVRPGPASPQLSAGDVERAWAAAKDTTSIAVIEAFRAHYGASNAFYDRLAQARIEELKKQVALAAPSPSSKRPLPEIGPLVAPPSLKELEKTGASTVPKLKPTPEEPGGESGSKLNVTFAQAVRCCAKGFLDSNAYQGLKTADEIKSWCAGVYRTATQQQRDRVCYQFQRQFGWKSLPTASE